VKKVVLIAFLAGPGPRCFTMYPIPLQKPPLYRSTMRDQA
jgi:hypothetical protein